MNQLLKKAALEFILKEYEFIPLIPKTTIKQNKITVCNLLIKFVINFKFAIVSHMDSDVK